jgi:nucleotide-binding universal stress UspA family protein
MRACMPALTGLLHPTDFSAGSERAFAHALRIATATGGGLSLTILHAEPREEYGRHWQDFPGVRSTLEAWGLIAPGSARDEVLAAVDVKIEKVAALGSDVVQAIGRYQASHPVDLVVLGTHGRSGLPRWLHPSIAERIALRSRAMTLFVPHQARGFVALEDGGVRLRNVLIPIARDPGPHAALEAATSLIGTLTQDAVQLSALHVGAPGDAPALRSIADPRFELRFIAREGNPVEEILAAAEELGSDLIAMTTRGQHGFLDALRGSTTQQIVRRAACPVLAVPAGR